MKLQTWSLITIQYQHLCEGSTKFTLTTFYHVFFHQQVIRPAEFVH